MLLMTLEPLSALFFNLEFICIEFSLHPACFFFIAICYIRLFMKPPQLKFFFVVCSHPLQLQLMGLLGICTLTSDLKRPLLLNVLFPFYVLAILLSLKIQNSLLLIHLQPILNLMTKLGTYRLRIFLTRTNSIYSRLIILQCIGCETDGRGIGWLS